MTKKENVNLDLDKIAEGGLNEKFKTEMKRVLKNLMDPNTSFKAKRKISITLSFASNERRSEIATTINVKSTLASPDGVDTTILKGMTDSGDVVANELKSGTPGQTYIGMDGIQRTDTGEAIDKVEAEDDQKPKEPAKNSDVIDFQNKA